MISKSNTSFVAVVCLCTGLLLVACAKDEVSSVDVERQAFDDLRAAVLDTVDDPARETEAIRLIDRLEKDLISMREAIAERRREVITLNADYDTPREDFEAYLDRVAREIRDNKAIVSETHKALRQAITREEVDAIAKAHSKAMQAAIASIQAI